MTPQEIQKERARLQAFLADQVSTHTESKRNHDLHLEKHVAEYTAVIERMKVHRDNMVKVHDDAIKSAHDHVVNQFALLDAEANKA